MNEEREQAYITLIKKLLECGDGQENQVLNDNWELVDLRLLQVMAVMVELLANKGRLKEVNFFINLLLQLQEHLGSSQQSKSIVKQTADRLLSLGILWFQVSQFTLALQIWHQTLSIYQAIKDSQGEANSLGRLGIVSKNLGLYEQAIDFLDRSGNIYNSLGLYEQAIEYHQQSLTIAQEIEERKSEERKQAYIAREIEERKNEEREQAHNKLIKKLLECEDGQENQVLKDNWELVDPSFLVVMGVVAELLDNNGKTKEANFFFDLLLQLGKYLGSSQQSQTIRQETAMSLLFLGERWYNTSQSSLALLFFQYTLTIYQEIKDRQGEANSLANLGNVYHFLGQYEQAINFHQQDLTIAQEIKDRQGEANSLANLGNVYHSLGQYEQAINLQKQSLSIKREIKDRYGEVNSLGGLGDTYNSLGQYERAIHFYQKSLAIAKEIKYRQGEANSIGSLGNTYYCLDQYEQAIDLQKQSLSIKREIKDRQGEANSLGSLGHIYDSLGKYEKAIEFHQQHLTIAQEIRHRQGEGAALSSLGIAYQSLGKYEKAIEFHQQHLTIAQEIKHCQAEASSLCNLGIAYRKLGRIKEAIHAFQASLKIATPEAMPHNCIITGGNLGNIAFSQSNWQLAIIGYQSALEAMEVLRNSSLTDEHRKQVLKKTLNVYEDIVESYINLKQYDKAIEYTDRSRSRFLADLFHNKDLYSKGDIPPQVQEYLDLQQQIDSLRFNSLSDSIMGERTSTPASTEANLEKIKQLAAKKQQVWEIIHRDNKELAAQLQPASLSFQQMQQLIPDRKTALINFYSTDEDTFIFILRHPDAVGDISLLETEELGEKSIACYTCKGQGIKTLQNWIGQTWLYPYINTTKQPLQYTTAQLLNCKPEDIKSGKITDTAILVTLTDGSQETINIARQEFLKQASQERTQLWEQWQNQMELTLAQLSQRLQLQQLIDNHLQDIEELIIVPHLYLHQIPFAALPISPKVADNLETTSPVPQTAGKTRDYRDWNLDTSDTTPTPPTNIDNNEYLSDRFRIRVVPSCQILDFCHQREAIETKTVGIVENATGDLNFTPEECRKLAQLYNVPPERHLKEKQATIANYLKLAQQVNILHSSHHASSDLWNALESGLRLSDGTLDLANLYIQSFPQLSEVFLSCCETNFTLSETTDDVLTLAGGFLTAGARSVVSTLWSVQDNSTAEFCQLYYQFRNQGETSPEALRKAQFELRKIPRFNHPYYWAAFVSQGER